MLLRTPRLLLTLDAAGDDPSPLAAGDGPVRLREQTEYALFVKGRRGARVAVEHRDPAILRGLREADGGRVVHGRVNFGSQVGRSTFVLRADGEVEAELEVEVVPTKLDYETDYRRLVDDTRAMLSALVHEYLRATVHPGSAAAAEPPSQLAWLSLLRHGIDELERAVEEVARRPLRALARDPRTTRAERVGRPDAALRRSVARGTGAGGALRLAGGEPLRERLEERRARPTLDTPEHRWLAARLQETGRRLARVRADEAARREGRRRERVLEEIDALAARVARLSRAEPVAAATAPPPPGFASMALLGSPGYREAYRALAALSLGLDLDGGPLDLSLKDLHLLYEYWCALTLVRLLAECLELPLPAGQLLAAEERGLRVALRHGHESAVVLGAPGGRTVTLTYNPRFAGDPLLVPQRPDFLLGVHDPGAPPRYLVLDAKYRLDDSPAYRHRYGSPGPPEEALNDLHRYRDAIVRPAGAAPERMVEAAVALFPHREEEPGGWQRSRLARSLPSLGVGAIPLLPGATGALEAWLRRVLR